MKSLTRKADSLIFGTRQLGELATFGRCLLVLFTMLMGFFAICYFMAVADYVVVSLIMLSLYFYVMFHVVSAVDKQFDATWRSK